jgi:hypothetical protein
LADQNQNQQNQGQQKAGQQQGGQQGQTLEQQRAQAQQQGGRLQADQQAGQQRSGGQGQQAGQQSAQDAQNVGRQAAQQRFDEEKRLTAERPQQSGNEGSQPTPTQQENDEIRAGLRHLDDKEDDRSGPDIKYGVRRLEPDEAKSKYETR